MAANHLAGVLDVFPNRLHVDDVMFAERFLAIEWNRCSRVDPGNHDASNRGNKGPNDRTTGDDENCPGGKSELGKSRARLKRSRCEGE